MWQTGKRLAAPLALGVALATLYYAIGSALGPDYSRYPGNNERFFLILLTLILLSWPIAFAAWSRLDRQPPVPGTRLARGLGTVMILGGLAIGTAWGRQLLDIAFGQLSGADALAYTDAPSAFWLVRVVDLGFIVPVCVATGIGLWRQAPMAIKAAYAVTSFMTLQAVSVLAMGAVMLARQDPTSTPGLVLVLAPIALGLAVLTGRLLVSYSLGSRMVNVLPRPTSLSTDRLPPCSSISPRAMGNPRPVPGVPSASAPRAR